jgi:hypothetical protein
MKHKGIFIPRSICLFIDEGGQGGGGGGSKPDIPDASADLKARLAQAEGSAMVVAQQLANDNYALRVSERNKTDEIDRLKVQLADAKKLVPVDGAKVLTTDEAKVFDALVALGKPEEIKAKLDKLPELESKVESHEKSKLLSRAAQTEGYVETVFAPLANNLEFEFKTVEANGQKKESAFVKMKVDGTEKVTPLAEYMQANHVDFLPALKPVQTTARKHVPQDMSGRPATTNVYDEIRAQKKAEQDKQAQEEKERRERAYSRSV